MKKLLILLPILITSFALNSCGEVSNSSKALSYGKVYESEEDVFNSDYDTSYKTFSYSVQNKETFILLVYNSLTCGCYINFKIANKKYLFDNNIDIYTMDVTNLENQELYGFSIPKSTEYPSIAIYKQGSLVKQTNYNSGNEIFTTNTAFIKFYTEYVNNPKIYHISKTKLDSYLADKKEFVMLFKSETCGDCTNLYLNVIDSFVNEKYNSIVNDFIYVIDKNYDFEGFVWQDIKDKYGLSSKINTNLGYSTGFVPTMQYISNGEIKAMDVYLNEAFENGKVSRSYFTENMIELQSYLENNKSFVIEGKTATTENDVMEIHNIISKKFLTTYCIK